MNPAIHSSDSLTVRPSSKDVVAKYVYFRDGKDPTPEDVVNSETLEGRLREGFVRIRQLLVSSDFFYSLAHMQQTQYTMKSRSLSSVTSTTKLRSQIQIHHSHQSSYQSLGPYKARTPPPRPL